LTTGAYLGPVTNAMSLSDLQERLDGLLQTLIHVVVIEDAGGAAVGQLVGMSLSQVIPGKGPMIQS
jgi:hypothetical protein